MLKLMGKEKFTIVPRRKKTGLLRLQTTMGLETVNKMGLETR